MRKIAVLFMLSLLATGISAQTDTLQLRAPLEVVTDSTKVAYADTLKPDFTVYLDTGIASWYGHHWNGRMTASGEIFCPDSMTAAHKSLPFGTIVKVTNLSNDSVIYVRITDRLPKKSSRSIDLTPVAAKQLGFYSKGLQRVAMESVGKTPVVKKKRSRGARKP